MKKFLLAGTTAFSAFLLLKILKGKKFYNLFVLSVVDHISCNGFVVSYSVVKKIVLLYNGFGIYSGDTTPGGVTERFSHFCL